MAEHTVAQEVRAPIHDVYKMWTHFTDYPKFMTHVKEVTYLDDTRSHWVVDMLGRHEWDAELEEWEPDRRIAWCSVDGLENAGVVTFEELSKRETLLTVELAYTPPAGPLGQAGEVLGGGAAFEAGLRRDLQRFADMVAAAAPEDLDPESGTYLFLETTLDEELDGAFALEAAETFPGGFVPTTSEPADAPQRDGELAGRAADRSGRAT
jgi:uncharacterized membrane protein